MICTIPYVHLRELIAKRHSGQRGIDTREIALTSGELLLYI